MRRASPFIFIFFLSLISLSCKEEKPEDLLYGKWKIVSLKIADKTLEEDHLGGKYYEFMPNGDVWVSTKSESTRKKYTRGTDFIYDPENGKRMQIMNISKYEMQIKGEAEDGQYFYLTLRRVKKQ